MTDESTRNQQHRERMARKQEVVDELIANATRDKGLLLVITGNGKGKSSSAFGMIARALGHGMKVGVVQFIKGAFSTGEETFFRRFPDEVEYHVMGEGFTWVTQDRDRDIQATEAGWRIAAAMLNNPDIDLVVLDELTIVLKYGYLPMERVLEALQQRAEGQHVVITGRGAKPELIEIADTVSEINNVKHAFNQGIRAQKGIEL
jgi:cob(I)alamin adenosyltransferase